MVWYGMVWHGMAWHGMVWYGMVWYGMVWLHKLSNFSIERCIKLKDFGRAECVQLHHFSDASNLGYGTVSYLQLVNEQKDIHCAFVAGKARVAPAKKTTTPRMELTAAIATVAVHIDRLVKRELEMKLHLFKILD